MKRLISLLLALTLLLAVLPLTAIAKGDTFTVMIYLCGTDLESEAGMATNDLLEMVRAGIRDNGNVTVYVQTGGTRKWNAEGITNRKAERWRLTEDGIELTDSLGKANMGDGETFYEFLQYGFRNYAADRYAVILWDHGSGATGGVCYDEITQDSLLMPEIYDAFTRASKLKGYKKLAFVGFDACLMANYEMACHMQPFAEYMIGSEELEPGTGWYYTDWLADLQQNPSISIEKLGKTIVDTFISATTRMDSSEYATLSVVDLRELDALHDALEGMAGSLNGELAEGNLRTISRARQNVRSFGEIFDNASDMIDLGVFADAFSRFDEANARKLERALSSAVVYSKHTRNLSDISGLSVLVPFATKKNAGIYLKAYDQYDLYPKYTGFVSSFVSNLTGQAYTFGSTSVEQTSVQQAQLDWFSQFASDESDYYQGLEDYFGVSDTQSTGEAAFSMDDFLSYLFGADTGTVEYTPDEENPYGDESQTPSSATGGLSTDENHQAPATYDIQTGQGDVAVQDPFANAEGDYAYTVSLTQEEMQHLAKVEANLMMDLSDEDGEFYVELGYVGKVEVDWKNGKIYGLFDGTWPHLDGQMVCMYDQICNDYYIRSLIPAKVNGVEQYLLVVFDADRPEGVVVGATEGYNEAGMPARGYTKLKKGDEVIPMYELLYWDENGEPQYEPFEGDPIKAGKDGYIAFSYDDVESDADYVYGFRLNDIFGDYQFTDFLTLSF